MLLDSTNLKCVVPQGSETEADDTIVFIFYIHKYKPGTDSYELKSSMALLRE